MLGYMSREALARRSAIARSPSSAARNSGSGKRARAPATPSSSSRCASDCDGDALLVTATPKGPTCHTGTTSCFYKRVELDSATIVAEDDGPPPHGAIDQLWATILDRKHGRGLTNREGKSYVRSLLDKGVEKVNAKIREEADELAVALAGETDDRVASEAADLLFHALVGLAARDLEPADVGEVVRARHGLSGIDEKAGRAPTNPENEGA